MPFKVKHVFVLMLENRSYDHMLGYSPIEGTDAETGQPTAANRLTGFRDGAEAGAPRRVIAPKGAVHERAGRKVVFVREAGKARLQEVETGAEGEDGTEILKGLQGGEEVVTGGAMVEDGAEVKLKEKK